MVRLRALELDGELVADVNEVYVRKYMGEYIREESSLSGI